MNKEDRHRVPVVIRTFKAGPDGDEFADIIQQGGMALVEAPMTEIHFRNPEPNVNPKEYNWLIFTSRNGVKSWFATQQQLSGQKIAVIGPLTGAALADFGVSADFTGSGKTGRIFAMELLPQLNAGDRLLLAVGDLASRDVEDVITKACEGQVTIKRVEVYSTSKPASINRDAVRQIIDDNYTLVAVASPSAVHNLMDELSSEAKVTRSATDLLPSSQLSYSTGKGFGVPRFATIGKVTSAAVCSYGGEPVIESAVQSFKALAESIVDYIKGTSK